MRKLLFFAILAAVLAGCKQTEYVTVEKVRTDTTYITKHQRDSEWLHDSIMVTEKGDTVRIERWHTKYIEREVHDTLYQSKHDTIPQPYPVTEYIEEPMSKMQRILMLFGLLAFMVGIVWLAYRLKRFLP